MPLPKPSFLPSLLEASHNVISYDPDHKAAARLGSVREVVSRAFTKLEGEGLIKVDEHRNAKVLNEEGLKNYAER